MNTHQVERNHAYSWLLSLGMLEIPEHILKIVSATPVDYETSKAAARAREHKAKKQWLLENIGVALKENIADPREIFKFLLDREKVIGRDIVIRARNGAYMSHSSFRNYVAIQKRDKKFKKQSMKVRILELYKQNYTEKQIVHELKCSTSYLYTCLMEAGFKNRTYNT